MASLFISKLATKFTNRQRQATGGGRLQLWRALVVLGVGGYLLLGALTETLRLYHWFLLLAIPAALLSAERGRRFFVDWSPLFLFWLGYDRLRLVQPFLLSRVAVEAPFLIEQRLFGWMTEGLGAGEVPAHAARLWLGTYAGTYTGEILSVGAQLIYFSHLVIFPALMLYWWTNAALKRGAEAKRQRFRRYRLAFTMLHLLAIAGYLLLPVAPPWWVSLYGHTPPTAELVAQVEMARAMDGVLVQRMIQTAPMWFGAVPSLHGAYPVLFLLLARGEQKPWLLWLIAAYGLLMWAATVMLNQHYVIDLLAGALFAWAAYGLATRFAKCEKIDAIHKTA